jgi:hypothetical protein
MSRTSLSTLGANRTSSSHLIRWPTVAAHTPCRFEIIVRPTAIIIIIFFFIIIFIIIFIIFIFIFINNNNIALSLHARRP